MDRRLATSLLSGALLAVPGCAETKFKIVSEPDAKIYVNQIDYGKGEAEVPVPAGLNVSQYYDIKIKKSGYRTLATRIDGDADYIYALILTGGGIGLGILIASLAFSSQSAEGATVGVTLSILSPVFLLVPPRSFKSEYRFPLKLDESS